MKTALLQSLKFAAVGVINTLIGLSVIYSLLYWCNPDPLLANVFGYVCGFAISFILNRSWTFDSRENIKAVFLRFALAFVFCYSLNLGVVYAAIYWYPMGIYVAEFAGVVVYTSSMFVVCRCLVFENRIE